jgi:hypothetical protein
MLEKRETTAGGFGAVQSGHVKSFAFCGPTAGIARFSTI